MYYTSIYPLFCVCRLTREDFACAPSDGDQILDQVLAVGCLATAGLAQQHNGLILTGGKQVAVGRLSHRIDMRSGVLAPTSFEHVHHLMGVRNRDEEDIKILATTTVLPTLHFWQFFNIQYRQT